MYREKSVEKTGIIYIKRIRKKINKREHEGKMKITMRVKQLIEEIRESKRSFCHIYIYMFFFLMSASLFKVKKVSLFEIQYFNLGKPQKDNGLFKWPGH